MVKCLKVVFFRALTQNAFLNLFQHSSFSEKIHAPLYLSMAHDLLVFERNLKTIFSQKGKMSPSQFGTSLVVGIVDGEWRKSKTKSTIPFHETVTLNVPDNVRFLS